MQQLLPVQKTVADPLTIYDDVRFPEPPAGRAYLYTNMVSSADGRAQIDGRAAGLGSSVDQRLMRRLRGLADCVVNGSGTLHADEVYAPLPEPIVARRLARGQAPQPLWAIFTASGNLPIEAPLFRKPPPRPILLIAEATPRDRRERLADAADLVVVGDERPDPATALRVLRERFGCRWVLSEGGPTLNHAMLSAGVMDELFLTFSPKIVGGDVKQIVEGDAFPREAWPRLRLISLFEHESELFLRYRVGAE